MKIWYGYLVFVEECIKADDRFVSFLCQRLRAVRGEGRGPPVQGDHHPQDDGEAEERGARHHAAQAAGRGLRARRVRGVEGEAVPPPKKKCQKMLQLKLFAVLLITLLQR